MGLYVVIFQEGKLQAFWGVNILYLWLIWPVNISYVIIIDSAPGYVGSDPSHRFGINRYMNELKCC